MSGSACTYFDLPCQDEVDRAFKRSTVHWKMKYEMEKQGIHPICVPIRISKPALMKHAERASDKGGEYYSIRVCRALRATTRRAIKVLLAECRKLDCVPMECRVSTFHDQMIVAGGSDDFVSALKAFPWPVMCPEPAPRETDNLLLCLNIFSVWNELADRLAR